MARSQQSGGKRQWLIVATVAAAIPALIFGGNAIYWNAFFLPAFEKSGIETVGRVVEIKEQPGERMRSRNVVVTHRPNGSKVEYRNWLSGGYLNAMTHDPDNGRTQVISVPSEEAEATPLKVGDALQIIYLPGDPSGRAIVKQDFKEAYQAPIKRQSLAMLFVAIFVALLAGSIAAGRANLNDR